MTRTREPRGSPPTTDVSLDSDYSGLPTRYTVVINPRDGRIMDAEQMLTTTAGKLNVPVPSVIQYTAYRPTHYTRSTR